MKKHKIFIGTKYIIIVFLSIGHLIFSQDNQPVVITRAESLRGIEELKVVVVTSFEGRGINTEKFKTNIELKIRLAGIKIAEDSQNTLFCALNINEKEYPLPGEEPANVYFYYIGLQFSQYCLTLKPNLTDFKQGPEIVNAITWYHSSFGTGTQWKIKEKIEESVDDLVEKFMNDYLKYNQE